MNSMGKRQWENLIGQNKKNTNKMYRINRNTNCKWETQKVSAQINQICQLYNSGEAFLWKWKHGENSQTSGVSLTQPGGKCQIELMPSALQGCESSPGKVYLLSKFRIEIFSPGCQTPFLACTSSPVFLSTIANCIPQSMSWLYVFGNSCPGWKGWGVWL